MYLNDTGNNGHGGDKVELHLLVRNIRTVQNKITFCYVQVKLSFCLCGKRSLVLNCCPPKMLANDVGGDKSTIIALWEHSFW